MDVVELVLLNNFLVFILFCETRLIKNHKQILRFNLKTRKAKRSNICYYLNLSLKMIIQKSSE